MVIIEILQLVDQLEDLLHDSRRVPGTGIVLVNEDECLRIIDQLRVGLPDELKQAERIKQERDRIIDEADREAQRILSQVAGHSRSVVSPPPVREVDERSRQLLAEAERDAREMRAGADQYARQSMLMLQKQLETLLEQVRRGLAHLESTSATASASD